MHKLSRARHFGPMVYRAVRGWAIDSGAQDQREDDGSSENNDHDELDNYNAD